MPGYGVVGPNEGSGLLPWSWAKERLEASRNYWIATTSPQGFPHAMPVWGVWDADETCFAFSCSPNARKARNLAANPQAVVMVDDTIECVSVEGTAGPVHEGERRTRWIERYLAKYRPVAPELNADFIAQHLLVEFAPERAFAIIERAEEFATRATRWVFEK